MCDGSSLQKALFQDRAISEIKRSLIKDGKRCIVVQGPSGTGKTWITEALTSEIPELSVLFATGDIVRISEPYTPFDKITHKRAKLETLAVDSAKVAAEIGGYISGFGSLGAKVFDWAASASSTINTNKYKDLSEEEIKWVGKVRRVSKGKPVLFVADNIHWWDEKSFKLLEKLIDFDGVSGDCFLSEIRFIIVRTVDPAQSDKTASLFHEWKRKSCPPLIEAPKCTPKQFQKALQVFGVDFDIPDHTLQDLYSISYGNLKLAKLISGVVSDDSNLDLDNFIKKVTKTGFLKTLLRERFKHRDDKVNSILKTLKSVALIGVYFYKSEAVCLTSKTNSNADKNLDSAHRTGLLNFDGEKISFSHPVILDFVYQELKESEIKDLSRKLAQCLRVLRPADYRRQADLLLAAEDERCAAEAMALYYLQLKRSHEVPSDYFDAEDQELLERFKMFDFCQKIEKSYDLFSQGVYGEAANIIKKIPEKIERGLALELAYARCLCKVESGRKEEAEAVAIEIDEFLELEEMEEFIEISTRYRLLQQQALVLAGTIEKARLNSIGLMSFLRKRATIDTDAELKYHLVLRKSNSIHDPFTARTHLIQAVSFFQSDTPNELPEYPLEYYRSLVNLSGVEIQLGDWDSACKNLGKVFDLVSKNEGFVFPRLDVALNNLGVARCRAELDSPKRCVEQQTIAVTHNEALSDNFHHRLNLVGMIVLSGDIDRADSILSEIESEFFNRRLSEQYIDFHLHCRRQVISYFRKDWELCKAQQKHLKLMIKDIDWPSRAALLNRSNLIESLFEEELSLSPHEFDTYFVKSDPVGTGPSWPHFGRGILFSELQFWSDS